MKKNIYLLLGLATVLCLLVTYWLFYNRLSEKEKILIGDAKKIWSLSFENRFGNKRLTSIQFQFLKDHTYVRYQYSYITKKRLVFNEAEVHPDIEFPRKMWHFHNDSILEFGEGIKSKILYMTSDSFALEDNIGANKKDTSIFYVVK